MKVWKLTWITLQRKRGKKFQKSIISLPQQLWNLDSREAKWNYDYGTKIDTKRNLSGHNGQPTKNLIINKFLRFLYA